MALSEPAAESAANNAFATAHVMLLLCISENGEGKGRMAMVIKFTILAVLAISLLL